MAMERTLGLHQLSAMDLTPFELVDAAADCGYGAVSLFTNAPHVPIEGQEGKFVFPTVLPAMKADMLARLAHHGLAVVNAEFFLLRAEADLEGYRPGLALGRALGASNAISHVFEADAGRAVDLLGRFCDIAAQEGMSVAIEFCQMTPGCKTIDQAKWFVDQVGRANLASASARCTWFAAAGRRRILPRPTRRSCATASSTTGTGCTWPRPISTRSTIASCPATATFRCAKFSPRCLSTRRSSSSARATPAAPERARLLGR